MVFASTAFVFFFLPVVLLLYYLLPGKYTKNILLLLFSLVFYAWGEPVYIVLILLSILINFVCGRIMDRIPEWRKPCLIAALAVNLGLLGFFKYYGLFIQTVNSLTGLSLRQTALTLPVGISFYTFQALSYIIDLYRGRIRVQKNLLYFAVYISMFPQLIAGPIVRYEDIENELETRTVDFGSLFRGFAVFTFGLAKKVLLANLLGSLFDLTGLSASGTDVVSAWTGLVSYGLQIYFDFSGYSDMAVGLGIMLGFRFPENFNAPYGAASVTDFWRRWHITLGTWFKEYVYIPLGGNRVKPWRHILNILIVWALTGFWHGASWNFLLWGLYYGGLLLFEKYVLFRKVKLPKVLQHIWTLFAVFLGWGLFLSTSLGEIGNTFGSLTGITASAFVTGTALYHLKCYGLVLVSAVLCSFPFVKHAKEALLQKHRIGLAATVLLLFLLSAVFLITQSYNPFLYFRF